MNSGSYTHSASMGAGVVNGLSRAFRSPDSGLVTRTSQKPRGEVIAGILVPRELPLSAVHLRNIMQAASDGCIIMPPMLTFYNRPETAQHMINHLVGKIMAMFGLAFGDFVPWSATEQTHVAK